MSAQLTSSPALPGRDSPHHHPAKPASLGGSPHASTLLPRRGRAGVFQVRLPAVPLSFLPRFGSWSESLGEVALEAAPRLASCVILDKLDSGA